MGLWLFYISCFGLVVLSFGSASTLLGRIPNIWKFGQKMDLYIYLSDEILQTKFDDMDLIFYLRDIEFGKHLSGIEYETSLLVSTKQNPLYLHLHLMKAGVHPDPDKSPFDPLNGIYKRYPLLKMMKRSAKKIDLLGKKEPLENPENPEVVPYWYPDIAVNLVNYDDILDISGFSQYSRRFVYADRIQKKYYPIIYFNEFWELKNKRIALLDDNENELPLKIHFSTISLPLFYIMNQFNFLMSSKRDSYYSYYNESENIKKFILETKPWLIVFTCCSTILYVLFEFFALKNDIEYWRKKKDMSGFSFRAILRNALIQFIIFFHLLDTETSLIVLLSVGAAIIMELWKLTQIFDIKWAKAKYIPFSYFPIFHEKYSNLKSKTQEDDTAKYLTLSTLPFLAAYSIWSLKYQEHKSWYSWILASLAGYAYTYGFISMIPQLFINYKSKSVVYMPWETFKYKTAKALIDNFFVFTIKMSWMHRIACFRVDVLLMIYFYQMWIYPVEMKRTNKYGQEAKNHDIKYDNKSQESNVHVSNTIESSSTKNRATKS